MSFKRLVCSLFIGAFLAGPSVAYAEDETQDSWKPVKSDFTAHNCFSPFGLSDDVGGSVVEIITRMKDHSVLTGTGSIIADSKDTQSNANHIVTAHHVVASGWEIYIVLSDGTFIGKAIPTVMTQEHLRHNSSNEVVSENDLAVLIIDQFASPEAEQKYRMIRGLPIAANRPGGMLEGVFDTPGGVQHGTSGAPIIKKDTGEIVGVMTQAFIENTFSGTKQKQVSGTDEYWSEEQKRFGVVDKKVFIPIKAKALGDGITAPYIMYSLGMAGVNYNKTDFDGEVIVPGFPERTCLVYDGKMHTDR